MLGHELIHALHSVRGEISEGYDDLDEYLRKADGGSASISKLQSVWDEKEEHLTIAKPNEKELIQLLKSNPTIEAEFEKLYKAAVAEKGAASSEGGRADLSEGEVFGLLERAVKEYHTTENDLREQAGLGPREGHSGVWKFDKEQMAQIRKHGELTITPPIDRGGYEEL